MFLIACMMLTLRAYRRRKAGVWREKKRIRPTDKQTERQTGRQTGRQTHGQRERERKSESERKRQRE